MKAKLVLIPLYVFWISCQAVWSQEDVALGDLSEGLRAYSSNGKMGFMDSMGRVVHPPTFHVPEGLETLPRFKEGLCMFFTTEDRGEEGTAVRYGFLDRAFRVSIPARMVYRGFHCDGFPSFFSKGHAVVESASNENGENENPGTYVIIDRSGKAIGKPFEYSMGCTAACVFFPEISDGFCAAQIGSVYGYLDATTGKVAIPGKYSTAGPFSEGIAAVEVDGRYIIFIDKSGRQVIDKRFYTVKAGTRNASLYSTPDGCDHPGGFVKGLMHIRYFENDGRGPLVNALIDREGKIILKRIAATAEGEVVDENKDFQAYKWRFGRD